MLNKASCYTVRLLRSYIILTAFNLKAQCYYAIQKSIINTFIIIESFVFLFQANVSNDIAYQLTKHAL